MISTPIKVYENGDAECGLMSLWRDEDQMIVQLRRGNLLVMKPLPRSEVQNLISALSDFASITEEEDR